MTKKNLGFPLVEVLGALAIGGFMTAGLSALIHSAMENLQR